MGIPFKLYEGKEANLPAELTAGGIYFCEDSGNVFIDVDIDGTVTRVPLGKKYVDDQLVDIREFIENQGSGIEIGDEAPTKESANVWINTSDEDEEGVEYLGVVTSINGQGGDVNISASDIDAAEKTHAAQHASGGSDPITPEMIEAVQTSASYYNASDTKFDLDTAVDSLMLIPRTMSKSCPIESSFVYVRQLFLGSVTANANRTQIAYAYPNSSGGIAYNSIAIRGCNSGTWSGWKQFATTDYALNKAGDIMTGVFSNRIDGIQSDFASFVSGLVLRAYQQDDWDGRRSLILGTRQATSLANALALGIMETGSWVEYPILHTGNKPSGSYTGTGAAWSEALNIGGIGEVVLIQSEKGLAIVTRRIVVSIPFGGSPTAYFVSGTGQYVNGLLTLLSGMETINASGVAYYYQVL